MGRAGGVVRQGNLVGVVGSGMEDGRGSEEGDARGAQGDHDTGHEGTGGGGGGRMQMRSGGAGVRAGAGAGGRATT